MAFTDAEKETLAEILRLSTLAGTDERTEFLAKVAAAEAIAGRETRIRGYIADWAEIPKEPVVKSGGASGITYETAKHQLSVRNNVALALGYPEVTLEVYAASLATSDFQIITISLGTLYSEEDATC